MSYNAVFPLRVMSYSVVFPSQGVSYIVKCFPSMRCLLCRVSPADDVLQCHVSPAGDVIPAREPLHAPGHQRTQYPADRLCSRQARRLRREFAPIQHLGPPEHLRRHPVLDGSGGTLSQWLVLVC